ncbi:MAG: hypothetical protein O3A01_07230 [bacterium]|nr:hypothetical protein [bacterium]
MGRPISSGAPSAPQNGTNLQTGKASPPAKAMQPTIQDQKGTAPPAHIGAPLPPGHPPITQKSAVLLQLEQKLSNADVSDKDRQTALKLTEKLLQSTTLDPSATLNVKQAKKDAEQDAKEFKTNLSALIKAASSLPAEAKAALQPFTDFMETSRQYADGEIDTPPSLSEFLYQVSGAEGNENLRDGVENLLGRVGRDESEEETDPASEKNKLEQRDAANMDQLFADLLRNPVGTPTGHKPRANIWAMMNVIFGAAFMFTLAPGLGMFYIMLMGADIQKSAPISDNA